MHALKLLLKRGALVAAANWQVTLVQSTADTLFKLLIAAPIVGGLMLAVLVVGAEPRELMSLDWRDMALTIARSLLSHPVVLTSFVLALGVIVVGGSLFIFLVKAGTVAVLVTGERIAGAIEEPPLHLDSLRQAARFTPELYADAATDLFPRYARLGFILIAVYGASGLAYLSLVYAIGLVGDRWGLAALGTAAFVVWITLVNLLYLLTQIVIAADDCSVATAANRVVAFLRQQARGVSMVFLVVLALVVLATGASLLATAALSLIAFVPFVGLAVLPLQLLAWIFRGIVFQYLGLTAIGAYVRLYRTHPAASARLVNSGRALQLEPDPGPL
jgi:hypothetical protein